MIGNATLKSSTFASNGFIADIMPTIDKATDRLFDVGKQYLQDQWGLGNGGNSVDQNLYNPAPSEKNSGNTAATVEPTPVGLVDINMGPNAIIALLVGGVILFFALK